MFPGADPQTKRKPQGANPDAFTNSMPPPGPDVAGPGPDMGGGLQPGPPQKESGPTYKDAMTNVLASGGSTTPPPNVAGGGYDGGKGLQPAGNPDAFTNGPMASNPRGGDVAMPGPMFTNSVAPTSLPPGDVAMPGPMSNSGGKGMPTGNPDAFNNGSLPPPQDVAMPGPQFNNSAAPPQSMAPPASAPMTAPPGNGLKPGWEDAGNGMVKNPTTGQMLPKNHPAYESIPDAPAPQTAAPPPSPGMPTGPAAPTSPPPPPPAPGLKPGWEDFGNGLAKNTATGQVLPTNHPLYEAAPGVAAPAAGPASPPPTAPPQTAAPPPIVPMTVPPAAPAPTSPPPPPPPPPGAPGGPPITGAEDVTNTTAAAGQQNAAGQATSIAQSLQQALINRLNPQTAPPSVDSDAIRPMIQANKLAEQRGTEAQRNFLAEQAARDGTDASGGFNSSMLGILADSAGRQGQFAGNAVQHLADQQNDNATNASNLAQTLLSGNANRLEQRNQFGRTMDQQNTQFGRNLDQQNSQFGRTLDEQHGQFGQTLAEQRRQADQAAELQRLGINTQGGLGQGDLALRGRLGDQQSNLGLLGLLMQNKQFGQSLGQQGAQFGAGLDQQGLLGLLGLL